MIAEQDILNARILIVDDQEVNVNLLEHILADAGYTCVSVSMDPKEVAALHRNNDYDLILLDLRCRKWMASKSWRPSRPMTATPTCP